MYTDLKKKLSGLIPLYDIPDTRIEDYEKIADHDIPIFKPLLLSKDRSYFYTTDSKERVLPENGILSGYGKKKASIFSRVLEDYYSSNQCPELIINNVGSGYVNSFLFPSPDYPPGFEYELETNEWRLKHSKPGDVIELFVEGIIPEGTVYNYKFRLKDIYSEKIILNFNSIKQLCV